MGEWDGEGWGEWSCRGDGKDELLLKTVSSEGEVAVPYQSGNSIHSLDQ